MWREIPFIHQVIAERPSEEEIGGLKELFKMIDTDNCGTTTSEELDTSWLWSELMESEINDLMEAVRKNFLCGNGCCGEN